MKKGALVKRLGGREKQIRGTLRKRYPFFCSAVGGESIGRFSYVRVQVGQLK